MVWNTRALGASSQGLPDSLPFLSCLSAEGDELQSQLTPTRSPSKLAPFSQRLSTQKRPPEHTAVPHKQLRASSRKQKAMEYFSSTEILEAACNESIPGLTGVSNFTVFLYCNLFEGENGSVNPTMAHMGLDLHAACSDAAWYLSAAEEDFFWVHVCSEFFAHEFNNTVCANSSFWLQRAHQVIDHFKS